jgi:hypothetical protein
VLPDKLLEQINELAETYAKAHTCRAMAQLAQSPAERANLAARADYWDAQVSDQYAQLTVALNSALPPTVYAAADQFAPVQMPTNHDIEVRGSLDDGARAVAVRFTGAQAVAVGTALIACAALGTQHSGGGRLAEILPPMPPDPPARPARPT